MAEASKESTSDSSQSTEQERPKLPPVDFSALIAELGTTAFCLPRWASKSGDKRGLRRSRNGKADN